MNKPSIHRNRGKFVSVLCLSTIGLMAGQAQAAFEDPASAAWGGWSRGDAGTVYQHWDVFSDDDTVTPNIQDSTPDIGNIGPGGAELRETTGAPFLTGGGNIYSPTAMTAFEVDIDGFGDTGLPVRVALQTRILGTEIDYGAVLLNGIGFDSRTELGRVALGGFGGSQVDTLFLWTLPAGSTVFSFAFQSDGSSMSLDQLAVDVAPVPLPLPVLLFGSGLAGLALRARRSA